MRINDKNTKKVFLALKICLKDDNGLSQQTQNTNF